MDRIKDKEKTKKINVTEKMQKYVLNSLAEGLEKISPLQRLIGLVLIFPAMIYLELMILYQSLRKFMDERPKKTKKNDLLRL